MPSITQTINKIHSFQHLSVGWHYGEGVPVDPQLIEIAENVLYKAQTLDIERTNAFPGVDGGIQLTFHYRQITLSLIWESDGSITIVEDEKGDIIEDLEGLTLEAAEDKLWDFSQKIQTLSELYTYSIGTKKMEDLKVALFSHLPVGVTTQRVSFQEFLLYRQSAYLRHNNPFASILPSTIHMSPATRLSFGRSVMKTLPTVHSNKVAALLATNVITTLSGGLKESVELFSLNQPKILRTL